jgi:hypothetical protein
MSDTLFADDQSATQAPEAGAAPSTPSIELPDEVAGLIGEGKKYSDVTTALGSIPHAQQHISTLEKELAETRAELEKRAKLEDAIAKLEGKDQFPVETKTESIDPAKLVEEVKASLRQDEQINRAKANLGTVESKLVEVYGDKAKEKFEEASARLNMSAQVLTALAKDSPEAALALIGVPKAEGNPQGTSESDVNTSALKDVGEPAPKKNVMYGASTKDVIDEWRNSAPKS